MNESSCFRFISSSQSFFSRSVTLICLLRESCVCCYPCITRARYCFQSVDLSTVRLTCVCQVSVGSSRVWSIHLDQMSIEQLSASHRPTFTPLRLVHLNLRPTPPPLPEIRLYCLRGVVSYGVIYLHVRWDSRPPKVGQAGYHFSFQTIENTMYRNYTV